MEQSSIDKGADYPSLGPAYFEAQRIAEQAMAKFEEDHFAPLAKKFTEEFYELAEDAIRGSLLSDVESNIQSNIWRTVDATVEALVGGDRWALERYALGDRHDHVKIRAAIAGHIPAELQDKRIADLEAQVASLTKSLDFYRNR